MQTDRPAAGTVDDTSGRRAVFDVEENHTMLPSTRSRTPSAAVFKNFPARERSDHFPSSCGDTFCPKCTRPPVAPVRAGQAGCGPHNPVRCAVAALGGDAGSARERLVAACEQRKQLGLLRPWLEARQAEGLPEGGPDAEVVKGALERIEKAAKAWW